MSIQNPPLLLSPSRGQSQSVRLGFGAGTLHCNQSAIFHAAVTIDKCIHIPPPPRKRCPPGRGKESERMKSRFKIRDLLADVGH